MTEKDRKRFDEILGKFRDFQTQHRDLSEDQWKRRIENLEKLVFFSLLCDAGEQGITPEQREMIRLVGWSDLMKFALGIENLISHSAGKILFKRSGRNS